MTAITSACRRYRYRLDPLRHRTWRVTHNGMLSLTYSATQFLFAIKSYRVMFIFSVAFALVKHERTKSFRECKPSIGCNRSLLIPL